MLRRALPVVMAMLLVLTVHQPSYSFAQRVSPRKKNKDMHEVVEGMSDREKHTVYSLHEQGFDSHSIKKTLGAEYDRFEMQNLVRAVRNAYDDKERKRKLSPSATVADEFDKKTRVPGTASRSVRRQQKKQARKSNKSAAKAQSKATRKAMKTKAKTTKAKNSNTKASKNKAKKSSTKNGRRNTSSRRR